MDQGNSNGLDIPGGGKVNGAASSPVPPIDEWAIIQLIPGAIEEFTQYIQLLQEGYKINHSIVVGNVAILTMLKRTYA